MAGEENGGRKLSWANTQSGIAGQRQIYPLYDQRHYQEKSCKNNVYLRDLKYT